MEKLLKCSLMSIFLDPHRASVIQPGSQKQIPLNLEVLLLEMEMLKNSASTQLLTAFGHLPERWA